MTESLDQVIDCRGQSCPRPILATARAARQLGDTGGEFTVLADDDAFPLDVESWCRTSGAELVDFLKQEGGYRARVRVAPTHQRRSSTPSPRSSTAVATEAPRFVEQVEQVDQIDQVEQIEQIEQAEQIEQVDARGMECPRPILAVARAARNSSATKLEILADDDAFAMDIRSWARTTGAALELLERTGDAYRAVVVLSPSPSTPPPAPVATTRPSTPASASARSGSLDLSRTALASARSALAGAVVGLDTLSVIAPDATYTSEIVNWSIENGHQLESLNGSGPVLAVLALNTTSASPSPPTASQAPMTPAAALATMTSTALAPRPAAGVAKQTPSATFLVLHNDKESLLAALMCANGAAAQGMDVLLYFTFFGLNLLRGQKPNPAHAKEKVTWAQRLFKWLMPKGPKNQTLSKLSFGGMGDFMMGGLMRDKNLMDLTELMEAAQEQGVRLVACTTAMSVMGITKRDLHPYDGLEYGGVAMFVESASNAEMSLVF